MDRFMAEVAEQDGDLIISRAHGFAYQLDRSSPCEYGTEYFAHYQALEGKEIAERINRGRSEIVAKHFDPVAPVLDIGIGSGEFIKNRPNTFGFDVNPVALEWLRERGLFREDLAAFAAVTMWDVIEHVETPESYFQLLRAGTYLFTSIPIFADLKRVRESRHYKPNEHLYYWTEAGFMAWMSRHGFALLERQTFEMDAGRDSIVTFAFRKNGDGL